MNKSDNPKVSVCVVTYNHERYIAQCLDSLIAQNFDGTLEILVSDDASIDRTPEIIRSYIEKYPDLIKATLQPINLGPCANLKYVHARASGDYIAHVDGDDFWLPTKLKSQLDILTLHPDATACLTNSIVVSENGARQGLFSDNTLETLDVEYLLTGRNFLQFSSIVYKRKQRANLNSLPDVFIDMEFYVHLIKNGTARYIKTPLSAYRSNSIGSTIKSQPLQVRLLYIQAINSAKNYVSNKAWQKSLANYTAYAITEEILAGRLKSIPKIAKEANLQTSPKSIALLFIEAARLVTKKILNKLTKPEAVAYKRH